MTLPFSVCSSWAPLWKRTNGSKRESAQTMAPGGQQVVMHWEPGWGLLCDQNRGKVTKPILWFNFASPETFGTFGAKYICIYIFVHTAGHRHIYTFIYKETKRTTHMETHTCALMFPKIKKQPCWLNAPANPNQQPVITKIGRPLACCQDTRPHT